MNLVDMQDIQAARDGDHQAYGRIIKRHQQAIAKRLWRFTRDRLELEELVHETFVQAWQSLHTYKHQAPLRHWLMRIATRVGYRYWKQRWRYAQIDDDAAQHLQVADNLDEQATDEVADVVHHLLSLLPPRDRMVLTLCYLEGQSHQQIAQQTGWSVVMVKVQAHRARTKLRKLAEKMGV
ncbi:MAG: RNA polymerase sigma factor [Phycisphaeraceae bacterium JB051]